jgi:hypothetical protein
MAARFGIEPAQLRGPWPGMPKMSDTLVEFAEPLLDMLPKDRAVAEVRSVLGLASALWNLSVVSQQEPEKSEELRREVVDAIEAAGMEECLAAKLVELMAERKRQLFPDDRRIVAGVEARRQGDMINIHALSALG